MEALDDEAREISQGYIDRGEWKHPIDALNMTYSQSVLSDFERQIATGLAELAKTRPVAMASEGTVSADEFKRLQEQVAALMNQNAELQSKAKRRL